MSRFSKKIFNSSQSINIVFTLMCQYYNSKWKNSIDVLENLWIKHCGLLFLLSFTAEADKSAVDPSAESAALPPPPPPDSSDDKPKEDVAEESLPPPPAPAPVEPTVEEKTDDEGAVSNKTSVESLKDTNENNSNNSDFSQQRGWYLKFVPFRVTQSLQQAVIYWLCVLCVWKKTAMFCIVYNIYCRLTWCRTCDSSFAALLSQFQTSCGVSFQHISRWQKRELTAMRHSLCFFSRWIV